VLVLFYRSNDKTLCAPSFLHYKNRVVLRHIENKAVCVRFVMCTFKRKSRVIFKKKMMSEMDPLMPKCKSQ
jgi:hypothetical protein